MNDINKYGLKPIYLKMILDIFAKNDKIEQAIIYESRAKGKFSAGSDIDIVIIAPDLEFFEYLKVLDELGELEMTYKIDHNKI